MNLNHNQIFAYFIILSSFYLAFKKNKKLQKNPKCKNEKLKGGRADCIDDSFFNKKSLAKGIKIEMEHTKNKSIAKEIAKDHLLEDPKYYDKLQKFIKKKNPLTQCLYSLNFSYKRNNQPIQNKTMLTKAWNITEAREKFQNILNKNFRNATLESLKISKIEC
jgi:hypothetical protein